MINSQKTVIIDKIMDLKDKTKKQSIELQEEIIKKKKRLESLFENLDLKTNNPAFVLSGVFALSHILGVLLKSHAINRLNESFKTEKSLQEKNDTLNILDYQISERLKIIEKAETHDLQDFLKENDVYSIFENDKLEKWLDKNDENKEPELNSKQKTQNRIKTIMSTIENIGENINGR